MKYFIACIGTETNTFSNMPTGDENFSETMLCHGDGSLRGRHILSGALRVWRRMVEERGAEVVESLAAFAEPAGITVRTVYEKLRDEILDDLKRAMPVDAVLLSMHGAMVAEGYPDCEGDLLEKVRGIVGPHTVLGAELDLHCHMTETMVENATALIAFKEYPHTDFNERAEELFKLCTDTVEGKIRPVMSVYDCRMISIWPTSPQPMHGFVDRMQALEGRDNVLSVSLGHGFIHGDVPEVGAKVFVITDNDHDKGASLARELGRELWAMRHEIAPNYLSIDEGLDLAMAIDGRPIVLADVSDNAGGGAPGDSTFILRRILDRGIKSVVSANYWDPIAVRFCIEAGEGASLGLRIGGKCGPESGDPVDLRVTVNKIVKNAVQTFCGVESPMGDGVWVSGKGVDLVLNSRRFQTGHPDAITQFALYPTSRKIIVVKSTQHFYGGFAPIAKEILYVTAPGATAPDTANIPYKNVTKPYWPRVEDPFAA